LSCAQEHEDNTCHPANRFGGLNRDIQRLASFDFQSSPILANAEAERVKGESKMARKDAMMGLRQILMRRRDALRQALAGDLSLLKEMRQQNSGDVIDAALDTAQDEISSQLAEVESRELGSIEIALERMRKGDYGRCDGCGQAIPLARLQALPYATTCIQCQREAEKNGEVVGGGNLSRVFEGGLADRDISAADLEIDVS
jgi:DnaK suppressor protein